jgi:hypothetical protein
LYIVGANNGNPKPAKERKKVAAARAVVIRKICKYAKADVDEVDITPEAACSVNASIRYAWML